MKIAIENVLQRIAAACARCGRDEDEIKLIAVSKNFPAEVVQEAYDTGLRAFGENKAQEFRDKSRLLNSDIEWHFIGHLQTNKIKYVVPRAGLIHSVDSLRLAQALAKYALRKEVNVNILLEVNTSAESSKFGIAPEALEDTFGEILELPGLVVKGLMTMAPFVNDERKVRNSFMLLRELQGKIMRFTAPEHVKELSMGMSADFEWAIEEGSTMVRIGTAIFGARRR